MCITFQEQMDILHSDIPLLIIFLMNAISFKTFMHRMCGVDILQFAGLSFILLSLLLHLKVKPWMIAVIALAASVLGTLLRNVSTGHLLTDYPCEFFWRSDSVSYFPLLNWFIFPVSGYLFGGLWRHCKDKKSFYRLITPVCCIVSALYFFFSYPTGAVYDLNLYYGVNTIHALFFIVIVMATLGICYFLTYLPDKLLKPLYWMSFHVNAIYCIHWVIVGSAGRYMWAGIVPACPDRFIVPLGILILLFSCLILTVCLNLRQKLFRYC